MVSLIENNTRIAVSFGGRIIVDATTADGFYLLLCDASLDKFLGDETGTCLAEFTVDALCTSGTVGSTGDKDSEVGVLRYFGNLIEVAHLGFVNELVGVELEVEIDRYTYADTTRKDAVATLAQTFIVALTASAERHSVSGELSPL